MSFENDKRIGTVVYFVQVVYMTEGQENQTWQVAKRFSEFTDFAKALTRVQSGSVKAPKISTSVTFGLKNSPQHRKPELHKFIQSVLALDCYREKLQDFLRKGADSNSDAAIKVLGHDTHTLIDRWIVIHI